MESHHRIVQPGDGKSHRFTPGELFTWKTLGEVNGGAMDFGELSVEPTVRVPQHIHHGHDEAFYVLRGTFRFKVDDELAEAPVGTFVFIPRGTAHAWTNIGSEAGRVAIIFTPGGMSGFFEELEPLVADLIGAADDLSKLDPVVLAKAETIFRRYAYELVGPPLA